MPRAKRRRERYRTRCARTPMPVAPRRGERWSLDLMSDPSGTTHQIAALAGHQSLSEEERNTHGADRERMAKPLMRDVDMNPAHPKRDTPAQPSATKGKLSCK